MSTSFVVVPPSIFRAPETIERLNRHFRLRTTFWPNDLAMDVGCSKGEADRLLGFLACVGYGKTYQNGATYAFKPKLPIQFVADPLADPRDDMLRTARKQFAAGGRGR